MILTGTAMVCRVRIFAPEDEVTKRALLWRAVSSGDQADADKISLEEQERAERAWCEANGYEVVGVLTVPGESRSDADVLTLFEEFAAKGVYAYHDLRRMWQPPRQFDVLVAYHDSRLGRSESLYAYVVTNVMRSGAQIYCIIGGWYHPDDYKLKMAIGMINVSTEMDRFVALTKAAKLVKAGKGTLVHGTPNWAYRVERDSAGKPLRKVPDESVRAVVEAAARLVIEGVGWLAVEQELFDRYGMGVDGQPYWRYCFYFLFHNPNFWGNEVINGRHRRTPGAKGIDLWVFDPAIPTPPETQMFYGVLQPYLPPDGDLSRDLRNELYRRRHSIRGAARPRNSHKFTGLLQCYYCGRMYVFHPAGRPHYKTYECHSKHNSRAADRCSKVRVILEKQVEAWFDRELRAALSAHDAEWFMRQEGSAAVGQQIGTMKAALDRLDAQISRAIDEQLATEDDALRRRYRQRVADLTAQLQHVEQTLRTVETQRSRDTGAAHSSFERLLKFTQLDAFWESGDTVVNQILHGLMGNKVVIIKDREIKGVADRP